MTDSSPPPEPGERRLDRPPSDRYLESTAPATATTPGSSAGSVGRAAAFGVVAGLAGVVATIALGGWLGLSAGLLVVAGAMGWSIGTAVVAGGSTALQAGVRPWLAVGIAIGSVALGQLGLWLYARTEGGVLTLPDYLAQTFGVLVPLQAVLAMGLAWWMAR